MAKMIPAVVAPDAPDSEKRVFSLLRDDPQTRDWTVFHSVGLSSAYTGQYGEVDFVALIPKRGVLCIEVKGGGVRCSGGLWTTTDRSGETSALHRSPFQQAREGMFKLLEATRQRFGPTSAEVRCPFGWAAIFTDCDAPPPSPEFLRRELLDRNDLERPLGNQLCEAPSLAEALAGRGAPGPGVLERLGKFLRPDFDRVPTLSTTLWNAEQRIAVLTEEQYAALDAVMENGAILVQGGAGTGKTMLALELARRLSAEGRSVLLSCFNRELGDWIASRVGRFGPGRIVSGNLHRLLRARLLDSEFRNIVSEEGPIDDGWYEAGALVIGAGEERFDTIIVDEAQDFPAARLVDLAEAWLMPGDQTPRICLFGDYSRQALYGHPDNARDLLRRRLRPAILPLRINCRNTRRITAETELLTGGYEIRPADEQPVGPSVERIFHAGADQLRKGLDHALQTLRAEGYKAEDIVILGPARRENSSIAGLASCGGFRIIDRTERGGTAGVVYTTIKAFKGLESPAVVLADLEPREDQATDALLYVGMSRARTRLIMLLPENSRQEIQRRERANLETVLSSLSNGI